MKRIVNISIYILFIILIIFLTYQNRHQAQVKKELGHYYMDNFNIIKDRTNQILHYIKANDLDSDKLLIYAGESIVCLDISQQLGLGKGAIPAYFYDISNRLENLSDYIRKGNQDKELLVDKKRELVIILETLQESYKLFEKENGEDPIKWYNNNFDTKYSSLFGNKINKFFNEKAKENKILEIH